MNEYARTEKIKKIGRNTIVLTKKQSKTKKPYPFQIPNKKEWLHGNLTYAHSNSYFTPRPMLICFAGNLTLIQET